jgi:hypothetical protein
LFCANQLRTPQRARVCNSFGEPFFELQSIADVVRSNAITVIRKYNLVQEKQAIMFDSEQECSLANTVWPRNFGYAFRL